MHAAVAHITKLISFHNFSSNTDLERPATAVGKKRDFIIRAKTVFLDTLDKDMMGRGLPYYIVHNTPGRNCDFCRFGIQCLGKNIHFHSVCMQPDRQ